MDCLHPHCPMGNGASDWTAVVNHPAARVRIADRAAVTAALEACGPLTSGICTIPADLVSTAAFKRILLLCPCLFAQISNVASARGVVHLCEISLQSPIDSSNVYEAFKIQHPKIEERSFLYPPANDGASGGDVMETLCCEVLTNHGLPHMALGSDSWPIWTSHSHVSLNSGKMKDLKLYGDVLIPSAPHNILISVKTESARERFVVSGNRLESVGFGFFNDASEFWTVSRINLLKRWGFVAIYMPDITLGRITSKLHEKGTANFAININGKALFRSLTCFGSDMVRVAGKLSSHL